MKCAFYYGENDFSFPVSFQFSEVPGLQFGDREITVFPPIDAEKWADHMGRTIGG
jgi:hypothetical protein